MNLEEIINKIIQGSLFLRLKDIVENNAWHDHETVFEHLIKTKDTAKEKITGEFVTNPEAEKLFLEFVGVDFDGLKKADLMVIAALLHDVGKILYLKEGDNQKSIVKTDSDGVTTIPGHEYWGSTIVDKLLEELSLTDKQMRYISGIIRLHDTFQGPYFPSKENWEYERILDDIKCRAEGLYIESMFNNYCDVYNAVSFQPYKELIIRIFSDPYFYTKREYYIP